MGCLTYLALQAGFALVPFIAFLVFTNLEWYWALLFGFATGQFLIGLVDIFWEGRKRKRVRLRKTRV